MLFASNYIRYGGKEYEEANHITPLALRRGVGGEAPKSPFSP